MSEIFANLGRVSATDLAYSAHAYLGNGLAQLAIQQATDQGTVNVGFSGGAACNLLLAKHIRKVVEAAGLRF